MKQKFFEKLVFSLFIFLLFYSCVYSDIMPIEDPKIDDNKPIEKIEDVEIKNNNNLVEYDSIQTNKEYANAENYSKSLDNILNEYKYKPINPDENYNLNDIFRPPYGQFVISSDAITYEDNNISAKGDILINYDYYYIKANKFYAHKAFENSTANAENILFTTCKNHEHPHWAIEAKTINITTGKDKAKLNFKNVGISVGKCKFIWLPFYNYTINRNSYKRVILFPFLTYSRSNGIGVKYKNRFFETNRFNLDTDIRWTKNKNFKYDIYMHYAFDRDYGFNPYMTGINAEDMIDYVNNIGRTSPYKNGLLSNEYKKRAHLTGSLGTVWKDEDRTLNGDRVEIYKTVEANISYSLDPIGNTKNLNINSLITPSATIGYAREKEDPVIDTYINKYSFDALVPYALTSYKGINIQPFFKFKYNNYHSHNSYKAYGLGLDFSKHYNDGSFWDIRYMEAKESGDPLFSYDSIQNERGLMVSGAKWINNKYMIGAWFGKNYRINKTNHYGISLGLKEDCFSFIAGYDFKKDKIYGDIQILGF